VFTDARDRLREWAAHSDAIGELSSDLAMPNRVRAYPIILDALLHFLTRGVVDRETSDALHRYWELGSRGHAPSTRRRGC
jgi:hypothetical protein